MVELTALTTLTTTYTFQKDQMFFCNCFKTTGPILRNTKHTGRKVLMGTGV